jgi:ubiquinone/menaquinone biosynthesis C-methylase UbiE
MPLFSRLKQTFFGLHKKEWEAAAAYDQWSAAYDSQPDNLMLALDEELVADLLNGITLESKIVADIGCGTGRHWSKILSRHPEKILGFDVSAGMLARLKEKYPQAETFLLTDNQLSGLEDGCCDLLLSTLTIAHIQNPEEALKEWYRVLKPGGSLIITDYHPAALIKGARRTFQYAQETIAIRNYVHSLEKLNEITRQLQFTPLRFMERNIDEGVKHYYIKQGAAALYEQFYGTPIIYGMHLTKTDAPA